MSWPPYRTFGPPSTGEGAARARGRSGRGRDCRPRRSSREPPRYDLFHVRSPCSRSDRGSTVGTARGAAAPPAPRLGGGRSGASRRLHLSRGAAHRPAPQSPGPSDRTLLDPEGACGCDRLLDLRCRCGIDDPRSRHGRGAADAPRQYPNRQLLYGRERTPPRDRRNARSRTFPGLARRAPPEARTRREDKDRSSSRPSGRRTSRSTRRRR